MKRVFNALFVMLMAVGCDQPISVEAQLVGTWSVDSINGLSLNEGISPDEEQAVLYHFNEDGTATFDAVNINIDQSLKGRWSVDDSILTVTYDTNASDLLIERIDSARLVLSAGGGQLMMKLSRSSGT